MPDTDIRVHEVTFCSRVAKWASCSTGGTVSFSTDVLSQPPAFREYVIVHELLPLKVPNHGKLFKSLHRAYLCPRTNQSARPRPSTTSQSAAHSEPWASSTSTP